MPNGSTLLLRVVGKIKPKGSIFLSLYPLLTLLNALSLAPQSYQELDKNMSQPMMKALYYSSVWYFHRASRSAVDALPFRTCSRGTLPSRRFPSPRSKMTKSCSKVLPSHIFLEDLRRIYSCVFVSVVTYCGVCGVCAHDFISMLGKPNSYGQPC